MKRLILLLSVSSLMWGYRSLNIPINAQVNLVVPNSSPFSSQNDYRVVIRFHNYTFPSALSFENLGTLNNGVIFQLYTDNTSNNYLCASGQVPSDNQGYSGNQNCLVVTGLTDVTIRYQRFSGIPSVAQAPTGGYVGQTEVMGVDNVSHTILSTHCALSAGNSFGCPLTPVTPPINLSGTGAWGNATAGFSIAWLKWFSTTVSPGTPLENENTQADLADFRFEGVYTNQATTSGVTMSPFSGSPTFVNSPILSPACVPYQSNFSGGSTNNSLLNYSYTLDGSTPSYVWQQTSGPSILGWSSHTASNPLISQGVFGSYNIQLTVLGSGGGGNSTCSVKVGFISTDNNNILSTSNSAINTLLGPQVKYGSNQWTWLDAVHFNTSNLVMNWQQTGQYYDFQYWNSAQSGTVTFTTGSNIVTGVGTNFQTLFCGGGTSPVNGAFIQLWNPNASLPGMKRVSIIQSCDSATQITLASPWNNTNVVNVSDCHLGGCNYNYGDTTLSYLGLWISNVYYSDFYDAVAGLYSMYYRTGIDTYLNAARTLADNFWVNQYDSGNNYYINQGLQASPRNRALLGLVLRALDGRSDMWAGLENVFNFEINEINGAISFYGGSLPPGQWFNTDPRESGYLLEGEALCALADPNPSQVTTCQNALVNAIENGMKTSRYPDGNWYTLQEQGPGVGCGNLGNSQCNNRATVTSAQLTNGSGTVVLCSQDTLTCPATSGGFYTGGASNPFLYNLNGTNYPACIWFLNSTTVAPSSNSDGDATAYYMVEDADGYHFHLTDFSGNPVNYTGTSGFHGWSTGNGACGFGVQPYMLGIMGTALDFSAKALSSFNPTASADAKAFNIQMANFNLANSYNSANGGMMYAVHYTNCQPPIAATNPGCTQLDNTSQAGVLTAEALRGIMTAYGNTSDPSLLAFADKLMTQMWAKPGYSSPAISVDWPNYYNWDYNQWSYPQIGGLGNWMGGTPPGIGIHKYYGMALGIGDSEAWPGYRVGGLIPTTPLTISVGFTLPSSANSVDISVVDSANSVGVTNCTSSPCNVNVQMGHGTHLLNLAYKNGANVVSTTSQSVVIP